MLHNQLSRTGQEIISAIEAGRITPRGIIDALPHLQPNTVRASLASLLRRDCVRRTSYGQYSVSPTLRKV